MTEDYDVPTAATHCDCEYCGRPFAREEWRDLHYGLEHASRLDDAAIDRFREAYAAEEDAIGMFRLKALAALVVLYFSLLMIYAVV